MEKQQAINYLEERIAHFMGKDKWDRVYVLNKLLMSVKESGETDFDMMDNVGLEYDPPLSRGIYIRC